MWRSCGSRAAVGADLQVGPLLRKPAGVHVLDELHDAVEVGFLIVVHREVAAVRAEQVSPVPRRLRRGRRGRRRGSRTSAQNRQDGREGGYFSTLNLLSTLNF